MCRGQGRIQWRHGPNFCPGRRGTPRRRSRRRGAHPTASPARKMASWIPPTPLQMCVGVVIAWCRRERSVHEDRMWSFVDRRDAECAGRMHRPEPAAVRRHRRGTSQPAAPHSRLHPQTPGIYRTWHTFYSAVCRNDIGSDAKKFLSVPNSVLLGKLKTYLFSLSFPDKSYLTDSVTCSNLYRIRLFVTKTANKEKVYSR